MAQLIGRSLQDGIVTYQKLDSSVSGDIAAAKSTANAALPSASFTDASVTSKLITGFSSVSGVVTGGDTILQAIEKLHGNDALKLPLTGGTMSGTLAMGSNKVTTAYVPVDGDDLVNKTALDNAITGTNWVQGVVSVFDLRGNLSVSGLNGLSPVAGQAYVVTDSGTPTAGTSDAMAAGDIAEFNGTSWKKIVANSGGFVPAGTQAILGGSGGTISSPYTNATDNGKIVSFTGSSNTGTLTSKTANNKATNIQDPGHISFYDNASFVYEGTVPSGSWVQFNGAGQVSAGVGLAKDGNTLSVLLGAGIAQLPTNEVGIDLATSSGLELTSSLASGQLQLSAATKASLALADAALPAASFSDSGVTSKLITGFSSVTGSVSASDTLLQAIDKLDGNSVAIGVVANAAKATADAALPSASFTNSAVTGKLITGFASGAGAVSGTDTILQAIEKLDGNIKAIPAAAAPYKEIITISGGDVTAQYKDAGFQAVADSMRVILLSSANLVVGEGIESVDYSISVVSNKTRITFLGAWATGGTQAIVATDKLALQYLK